MEQRQTGSNIQTILASWRRPGQINLLGTSALAGAVKSAEARARRLYYAHSLIICASVLAFVIIISVVGHF